jgi:tetratricopeptide (TPR) repeat protein
MAKKKKEQNTTPAQKPAPVKAQTGATGVNVAEQRSFFDNTKVAIGVLVVAVLLAYIGGFGNEFVHFDDNYYVTDNLLVLHPTFPNLLRLLRAECAYNYHPLTMASLWLTSLLSGKGPAGFIITNTLIHITNTILIFYFTRRLTKNNNLIAFFTALLWGVHPMHAESVSWISERKDVLYSFFFLLSCIQYTKFLETEKTKFWIYTFIFFVLSCFAKGMAVVLPFVLILLDYWFDKKIWTTKSILQKIPYFVVALLFGLLAINIQSGGDLGGRIEKLTQLDESAIKNSLTLVQRICFGFYGFWVYIIKFLVPYNLHNFYAYPYLDAYNDPQYLIAPVLAIAFLVFIATQYRKKKVLFFGIMFFFFTIITVLQFLSVGVAILAERYTYIPYFGLIFLVVYWLSEKVNPKTLTFALGAVALIFIFLTFRQTQTYKDTGTLFSNSYQYEPKSDRVNEILINYYGEKGDFPETLSYGEAAVANGITSWRILVFLGKAYYFTGNLPKSIEFWAKAMPIVPTNYKTSVFAERGMMFRAAGKYPESVNDMDTAMKYSTKRNDKVMSAMFYERALSYRLGGSFVQAINDFDSSVKLDPPRFDSLIKDRAYTELLAGKWQDAKQDYTTMINKGLSKDTAYHNRGCAEFNLGDKTTAIADIKEALKLNPNYTDAKNNLIKMEAAK